MDTPHKFTPEQETAIGHLVATYWGSDFQTGMVGSTPIIYAQRGPGSRVQSWSVNADGTVLSQ